MICQNCKRELPVEQFELYPTGTRRRICRHCHYVLHTHEGRRKWVLRQLAKVALRGMLQTEPPQESVEPLQKKLKAP